MPTFTKRTIQTFHYHRNRVIYASIYNITKILLYPKYTVSYHRDFAPYPNFLFQPSNKKGYARKTNVSLPSLHFIWAFAQPFYMPQKYHIFYFETIKLTYRLKIGKGRAFEWYNVQLLNKARALRGERSEFESLETIYYN